MSCGLFSALSEGTILDNHQLICLYMLSQLLERELDKCLRLVVAIPMDMSALYGEGGKETMKLQKLIDR